MTEVLTTDGSSLTIADAEMKFCYNPGRGFCTSTRCMGWRWEGSEFEHLNVDGREIMRDNRITILYGSQFYKQSEVKCPGPEWTFESYGSTMEDPAGHWKRKIPLHQRKGYCGRCEPRVVEVEVG